MQVLTPILYADDTKLFYESNDLDGDADIINNDLNLLNNWCIKNKLTINFTKTNYIVLKHSQNRFKFTGKLYFNKSIINPKDSITFLGVTIENNLTGHSMSAI